MADGFPEKQWKDKAGHTWTLSKYGRYGRTNYTGFRADRENAEPVFAYSLKALKLRLNELAQ